MKALALFVIASGLYAQTYSISPGGTVSVTGGGTLPNTSLLTGGGNSTLKAPSSTTTLDTSGNFSTPGTITTGVGGSAAGFLQLGQGTSPALGTTAIQFAAPASVTSYQFILPGAAATGVLLNTNSANVVTQSCVGTTGSGNFARVTSPSFTDPSIGGHEAFTGTAPTITSGCGTGSPSLDSTASDNTGTLTLGTAPGSCLLTFATTWTTIPHCTVTPQSGTLAAYATTATTLTITATGLTGKIDYRCSK